MSPESVDLRQLTPDNLNLAIEQWEKLDRLVDRSHPLFPEYLKLSAKAKSGYELLKMKISQPGGIADIDSTILGLNELYDNALVIRGQMAADGMKKDLGIASGASFESAIDERLNVAFEGVDDSMRTAIESELAPMLYGLGVNPADVRAGDLTGNYYFLPRSGAVDFGKVRKAKQKVEKLREAGKVSPGLVNIANLLEAGIRRIESIDPAATAQFKLYEDNKPVPVGDGRLPRLVGAVGAGLITAFGLGQFLFHAAKDKEGKGTHFSPLIVGWAAVAMACVNPKIFTQSNSDKVLEQITNLGRPETRKVIGGGFNNPEALAELQELRTTNQKELTNLSKLDSLTVAQVEGLTGSTDSPLTKTLNAMLPSLRPAALRTLGLRQMNEGEIEVAQTFMKTPGII